MVLRVGWKAFKLPCSPAPSLLSPAPAPSLKPLTSTPHFTPSSSILSRPSMGFQPRRCGLRGTCQRDQKAMKTTKLQSKVALSRPDLAFLTWTWPHAAKSPPCLPPASSTAALLSS
eukprot:1480409-Rhodomonas_salina.1